ncbi:hypothetical protein AAMO2058_001569900 [Amorphochlora amoebiformis]
MSGDKMHDMKMGGMEMDSESMASRKGDMGGMAMTFQWGYNVVVLFDWLHVDGYIAYNLMCLVIIGLCILKQYLVQHQISLTGYRQRKLEETIVYGMHTTLGYLIMLVAMTFNIGIFIAIMAGCTLGHYYYPPIPQGFSVKSGDIQSKEMQIKRAATLGTRCH